MLANLISSSVTIDVITSISIALAGALLVALRQYFAAWRWKRFLRGGHNAPIAVVTGQIYFPESHHRYMAGGDIASLVSVTGVMKTIAPKAKVFHAFSDELTEAQYFGNIISIGGPKHNGLTRSALECIKDFLPIVFEENVMRVQLSNSGERGWRRLFWAENRPPIAGSYVCKKDDGVVVEDYGIVIRCINPLDPLKKSVLWCIAGSGSNGCFAAAELLRRVTSKEIAHSRLLRGAIRGGSASVCLVKAVMDSGKFVSIQPRFVLTNRRFLFWNYRKLHYVEADDFNYRFIGRTYIPVRTPQKLLGADAAAR